MQALAAGDHRVDVLVGLDVEVDDDRALVVDHLLDHLGHVGLVVAADAADAVGLGGVVDVGLDPQTRFRYPQLTVTYEAGAPPGIAGLG